MRRIAVDAMGSDLAPRSEVEGAVLAAREHGVEVLLVGREELIRKELAQHDISGLPVRVVHASEVVTMKDAGARAFRRKRDSSIRVGAQLVRDGKADGLISAGNTGAVGVAVKLLWGGLEGVDRPALAGIFPTSDGRPSVMLDIGASVDSKPQHLEQFAVMGEIFYRVILGGERPRVGLLSNGTEDVKGNELTREAHQLLKALDINFVGNVEGRDLYNGRVDVIVCDGFIGNVALKISEGLVETFGTLLKEALSSDLSSIVGSVLVRRALKLFKKRLDYSEYGGVPMLGVRGGCIICHGSSNGIAIKNAIRLAGDFSDRRVNEKIEAELAGVHAAEPKSEAGGEPRPWAGK